MFSVKTDWRNRQTKAEQVQKARCCKCGRLRPVNEMGEIGFEVYMCPGGCKHEG
jgi:hypothetical protein